MSGNARSVSALAQVSRHGGAAGVDGQRCQKYTRHAPERLQRLQQQLQRGDYHFERGHRWPREKSLQKFRDAIRQKTPRLRPDSMNLIVGEVNRTLRGWFEYFKRSIANVMERKDKWVRHRLRAILRKRHCRRQRDKTPRNQRWPNAYFADLGLFSLAIARDKASQLQR